MAPPQAKVDASVVDGTLYIHALADYVRQHESKLADFVRRGPVPTAPSWTTILTLGVVSSDVPVPRPPPLVLRFDPHHLYYLLLKFDEAGIPGIGALDVLIDGGPNRPVSINYGGMSLAVPDSDRMSLRSTFSGVSSFSLGSAWWGASPPPPDATADVRYLYSSCTKLPALRLGPFSFSSNPGLNAKPIPTLSKPVKDFTDCPPPDTAVPLYAFKNLQSLALDELDPRSFLGWDVLSMQLRSLEVKRSGIEDIGELICDAVVEDAERRKQGRGGVGEERRRRQGLSELSLDGSTPPVLPPGAYPVPPAASWSRLAHLSLARNSLTFIPSPPLLHLASLTSLDLSSNLLISVPPSLSALHSLRSLNLSDNMIDSLHGLAKALGAISVLNLSQNRLENLSGLDRLLALERLDLRENRLRESLEVSRLASLPVLSEIYIDANPFAKKVEEGGEEGWRVKCFSYFAAEGRKSIKIDGTGPGMNERRALSVIEEGSGRQRSASEGASGGQEARVAAAAGEAKVVGRRSVTTPHAGRVARGKASHPDLPSASSPPGSRTSSPPVSPSQHAKQHRRRKPGHRIVDLDSTSRAAPASSTAPSSQAGDHSGTEASNDSEDTSSPHLHPHLHPPSSTKLYLDRRVPSEVAEEPESASGATGSSSSSSNNNNPRRHTRYPTSPPSTTSRVLPTIPATNGSSSVGADRRQIRARLSTSLFDPLPDPSPAPTSSSDDPFASTTAPPLPSSTSTVAPAEKSADAFRKRIEALRSEVGESWLSVLGEREMALERSNHSDVIPAPPASSASAALVEPPAKAVASTAPVGVGDDEPAVKVVKGKKKKKGKKKASKSPSEGGTTVEPGPSSTPAT
ncbi:hypothetical protein RQP46_005776 [Phenoliferia psychrophenolica]